MSPTIRVLVVDDHPVVRRGLVTMLEQHADLLVVGECDSAEDAIRRCDGLGPEVVLMDLVLPGMSGVEATRTLLALWPELKIVMLTGSVEIDDVNRAIEAGAIGYLAKTSGSEALASAIRSARAGQASLGPEAANALVFSAKAPKFPRDPLSEREMQVLTLMVEGCSNREIAERLTLGRSTIKYHISNVFDKLGVQTRTEAAALALRQGLID
jgi:NarL family two-component system response regulator LiaR